MKVDGVVVGAAAGWGGGGRKGRSNIRGRVFLGWCGPDLGGGLRLACLGLAVP